MAISASQPLSTSPVKKFFLAHWLTDEAYAIENETDSIKSKTIIRLSILFYWSISTAIGGLCHTILPDFIGIYLVGLTFPISAILVTLSFSHIKSYVLKGMSQIKPHLVKIIACFITSILLLMLIGEGYFWIPSIFIGYFILSSPKLKSSVL